MEAAIDNMEQSVKTADGRLGTIAWKLDEFQKGIEVDKKTSVIQLMQGIHQIREDYESLQEDIRQVHSLQKQLTNSLKDQVNQMKGKYAALRTKLSQTSI
ncbi:unnamed protein product [Bemisia tabaci]|uniref:Ska2 N-terminal domain-containing protein n=1 Tax=Bemisia tabaci TaxID=7038 RepID=A0A9P0F4E6_BEMTA|nr:PREDICTED: uncharacterized protein LOC109041415 [Bemisia tabaci]CAH0391655.1 unnamed protein product [Bemisia tabaci]